MNIAYLLSAVAIGIAFAAQPAVNGTTARVFGSAIAAATLSISITLVACLVIMVALKATPTPAMFAKLPWWAVFGGFIGVLVVAGGAAIVPVTGAALFFVCLIAGQLIGSVLIDAVGAFRLPVRELSTLRLAGIGLVLAGVVLVHLSATARG